VKNGFILPDPCRQLLLDDLPHPVFFLHFQHNAIAAVVTHIHSEQSFLQSIGFAEIEFPQTAVGLHQLGELNVSDELNLHKAYFRIFKLSYNEPTIRSAAAFLKNSEFFTQG